MDIKIQNFEKFFNLSSDFDRATFETPKLPKKQRKSSQRCGSQGKGQKWALKSEIENF